MLTLNDGRAELWQWDTGRTLSVDADCSQVHFSNKVFGRSIDVDVAGGTAIIPDVLLQTDKDLNVWAFVGTAENGYTKISKTFKVNRRNKPADYVFTQTDQITLQTIQSQIGDLADLTTEAKDTLVSAINEAARTGGGAGSMDLRVAGGYVQYSSDGGMTWTNLIAMADLKGDPGETGKDGHSPVVTATKSGKTTTISVDGAAIATVEDGADGKPGTDGADGKSAYAYAVGGGYTGTEAEFAAKLAQEKYANPNALTFTGAVTGSYDGSAPVNVEIPSGGGGSGSSENWRLVNTVTTTEDVADIRITQDSAGNPLSLKKVKIFAKVRGNSANLSAWCRITVNNLTNNFYCDLQNTFAAKEGQDYYNYARADFAIYAGRLMLELLLRSLNNAASKNSLFFMSNTGCNENYPDVVEAITSIRIWSASAGIGAGTELMIYGVDA